MGGRGEACGDMGAEAGGAMGNGGGGEAGSALRGEGGEGGWSAGKDSMGLSDFCFFFVRKRVGDDDLCRNGAYTLCTVPRHI